ncbi:MAG TPA: GFA family protein [Polyangiales bacterium]|nr:GFA family protein [Polyangiales bacterium]
MTLRSAACSCGQLSLTADGEPVRVGVCHCLACQRRTGSAFGYQAHFRSEQVRVVGESTTYVRVAESGNHVTFHFCPVCGAIVHYRTNEHPELIGVPVGAFASPGFEFPMFSAWEEHMHPWLRS